MKLTVLVESSSKQDIAHKHNQSLERPTHDAREEEAEEEEGDEIPELEFGLPDESLGPEVESDMRKKRYLNHFPKDGELDGEGKWWTIDLMSSSSSSSRGVEKGKGKGKDQGVFFLYGGKVPWISKDVSSLPPSFSLLSM
jgi:hypothetical protein